MTSALSPQIAAAVSRALAAGEGFVEEIEADNFAGGGGASEGIKRATGRDVKIAVNHNPEALGMHQINHPGADHYCEDVFAVDPVQATRGRPVGLAWFSPDCRHFSKAKGGKPVERKIRGLAWVAVKWAKLVRPRIICIENVSEILTWGPLLEDNTPDPDKKGITFKRFVTTLRNLGYDVDWRELVAADYGAPTTRKRLFIIARCDGAPIVWPKATHSKNGEIIGTRPWRTAAEIIDWGLPCPSIFLSKKEGKLAGVKRPLVPATLRRIFTGLRRYVLESENPFIVPMQYALNMKGGEDRGTLHTQLEMFDRPGAARLVVPTLIQTGYGERPGQTPRVPGLDKPLGTVVACGVKHAVVAAFLAKHYGGVVGHRVDRPTSTITSKDHHALVAARLEIAKPFSGDDHFQEVRAFMLKYYSEGGQHSGVDEPVHTIPTKARMGLVTVSGYDYQVTDIGMRMLAPEELYRAQGFGNHYIHRYTADGRSLSVSAQTRMCGNSVSPDQAEAVVRANYTPQRYMESDVAIAAAA